MQILYVLFGNFSNPISSALLRSTDHGLLLKAAKSEVLRIGLSSSEVSGVLVDFKGE